MAPSGWVSIPRDAAGIVPAVSEARAASPVALTSLSHGAGCGCKLPAAALLPIVRGLPEVAEARLLVGSNTADDAAVFRLTDEIALVHDDRLLHADRRRPLRLRPDRGGERALGRLRHGRRAAGGDERRRVSARTARRRRPARDPARRRGRRRGRRDRRRRRPLDRRSRAEVRHVGHRHRASGRADLQRRRAGRATCSSSRSRSASARSRPRASAAAATTTCSRWRSRR